MDLRCVRNFGIVAHIDAGTTTVSAPMLSCVELPGDEGGPEVTVTKTPVHGTREEVALRRSELFAGGMLGQLAA